MRVIMSRALRLQHISTSKSHRRREQHGYILLTLLLAVTLFTVAAVAVLPTISQQIKRDREDELRHRGTEYMRAIEHFYRRYGRYPSTMEELLNTRKARSIRRLYKDPMSRDRATGQEKDFKALHQMDISLNNSPLGPMPVASETPAEGDPGGQSELAGSGVQPSEPQGSGGLQSSSTRGFSSSPLGNASNSGRGSSPSASPVSDSNSDSDAATFGGGGPILGVASTNKGKTIRTFFGKDHYNDWLFIYIDGLQRGGQLTGPVNPNLPRANLDSLPQLPTGTGVAGQGLGQGQGSTSNTGQTQFGSQSQQGSTQAPPQQ
jgi:type II secretory pathway pseudopilin PulG